MYLAALFRIVIALSLLVMGQQAFAQTALEVSIVKIESSHNIPVFTTEVINRSTYPITFLNHGAYYGAQVKTSTGNNLNDIRNWGAADEWPRLSCHDLVTLKPNEKKVLFFFAVNEAANLRPGSYYVIPFLNYPRISELPADVRQVYRQKKLNMLYNRLILGKQKHFIATVETVGKKRYITYHLSE